MRRSRLDSEKGLILRRTAAAIAVMSLWTMLIACAGEGSEEAEESGAQDRMRELPVGEGPSGAFAEQLDSTAALSGALREKIDVYYGNQALLRDLAVEDPRWSEMSGYGLGPAGVPRSRDELSKILGIETLAAQTLYQIGFGGDALFLVEGNQDTDAIAAAAEASGWTDEEGVFVFDDDSADFFLGDLYATQLIANDGSVLMGEEQANMGRLDEHPEGHETLLRNEDFAAVIACLGDPVAARVIDTRDMSWLQATGTNPLFGQVAIGVYPGEVVQTVVCALSDEPDALADTILTDTTNEPPVELTEGTEMKRIVDVDVNVDGSLVRAVFDLAEDAPPNAIIDFALSPLRIPGFR